MEIMQGRHSILYLPRVVLLAISSVIPSAKGFDGSLDFYHTFCGNQIVGIFKISDL